MNNNKIILLNEIIKNIYRMPDLDQFMHYILDAIDPLIPGTASSFYLGSNDKDKPLYNPVARNIPMESLVEYMNETYKSDFSRWHFMGGKSVVYRETDLYSEDARKKADYYRVVFLEQNVYYSAQMGLSYNGEFLGIISLFRSKDDTDFSDEDLFVLDILKDHLDYRLYREKVKREHLGSRNINDLNSSYDSNFFRDKYGLTTRECDVLELLFKGHSNEDICNSLSITSSTINKHTLNIYKKLGINHRWELIKFRD